MAFWFKLLIIFWVYLSVGFGVVLAGQVIAHKVEQMEDYYDWYISFKLDPDEDDFAVNAVCSIIFWPFVLIGCTIMLIEVGLKILFRKLFEELDKKK